ncbi:hypothetical protein ACA910_001952 [Epithemia clementina (nom. ined.)]
MAWTKEQAHLLGTFVQCQKSQRFLHPVDNGYMMCLSMYAGPDLIIALGMSLWIHSFDNPCRILQELTIGLMINTRKFGTMLALIFVPCGMKALVYGALEENGMFYQLLQK